MRRILTTIGVVLLVYMVWVFISYDWHSPFDNPTNRLFFTFITLFVGLMTFSFPGWDD
jgi:NhaP-type Na+/H+ or K+/H+ antiporter